jgi:hypothetical protein
MEQCQHTPEIGGRRAGPTLVQIDERDESVCSNAILGVYIAV